jgi:4-amino-4-deoxy-L-arabinose transferase-like glycosyltransferase
LPSRAIAERAGLIGWGLALWLGWAGGVVVAGGSPFDRAMPFFVAAMLAAFASSFTWPSLVSCTLAAIQALPTPRSRASVVASGAALCLLALPLTAALDYAVAAWAWVIGVLAITLACAVPERFERPSRSTQVLLAITLAAFLLRVVDLAALPPEVHGDEAAVGNDARLLFTFNQPNLFGLGWYQIDEISFAISAAFMHVFGDNLFGLRLASAVQGTLSITFTYLLVQRLFSMRAAVIAACLLAGNEVHLHFSRTGFTYMQAGIVTVLLLYLMHRALDRRGLLDYVLFGIVGGLSLLVYAAARLAPVLVVLYLAHLLVRERMAFVRAHGVGLLVAVAMALVLFAPMLVVYSMDPSAFNVRTGDVSVVSGTGYAHQLAAYQVTTLTDVLRIQTQRTLESFVFGGEQSQQFAHPTPLLDPWTGALFVAGVAAFSWRLRQPAYFLLGMWLWLSLILGLILTVDAPFSPHMTGMLPLLGIYPALFVDAGWRSGERLKPTIARPAFAAFAGAVVMFALVANVRDYVQVHVVTLQPAGFATLLGRYIADVNARYRVYLISRRETSLTYDSTRFLAPNPDAEDLHDQPLTTLRRPTNGKGMAFVVEAALPDAAGRLAELRARYPGGDEAAHRNTRGDLLFTTYELPPA